MNQIQTQDIIQYVEENIGSFHKNRIDSLTSLRLDKVLKRKNPYLFKAKNNITAEQIVRGIVDAHISSNEETLFGNWLEGLAIFINNKVFGGRKSGIQGIDLEFENDGQRYIVSIKSRPNWGNSSQINKMISDFHSAKRTLHTSGSKQNIVFVNGCCYGQDRASDKKGIYFKYCGQKFWNFISGEENLYIDLIEPLGYKSKEKDDEYMKLYSDMINIFTYEFFTNFCNKKGSIDWKKLVEFNSKDIKT